MGEKVSNACYLIYFKQGYKCYTYPIYGKPHNFLVEMTTVVNTQLYIDIEDDLLKIPTHIHSRKVER